MDAVVPGWPVIGNLLQLKEKKPHKTFLRWAEAYGPIYSIKTGASTVIVLNSTEVAKEVWFSAFIFFIFNTFICGFHLRFSTKHPTELYSLSEPIHFAYRYIAVALFKVQTQKQQLRQFNPVHINQTQPSFAYNSASHSMTEKLIYRPENGQGGVKSAFLCADIFKVRVWVWEQIL